VWVRHHQNATTADQPVTAQALRAPASIAAIQAALREIPITNLTVYNVDGIVILKGEADAQNSARAADTVRALGVQRVANLIHTPSAPDDELIRMAAERQLARAPQLDGCRIRVSCDRGVVKVHATVHSELQADAARQVVKGIKGAQRVELEMARF
jgi:osmotically-inducible protein OsmY